MAELVAKNRACSRDFLVPPKTNLALVCENGGSKEETILDFLFSVVKFGLFSGEILKLCDFSWHFFGTQKCHVTNQPNGKAAVSLARGAFKQGKDLRSRKSGGWHGPYSKNWRHPGWVKSECFFLYIADRGQPFRIWFPCFRMFVFFLWNWTSTKNGRKDFRGYL